MLDDVELQQVQKIESEDEAVVQRHSVPALEGDFLQDLGRRSTRVDLTGVLTGPEAAKGLQKLRDKFRKTEPISFVADIATATVVDKVLIEQMEVEELAGKPERFAYALSVLEFVPPPKPETEPPPPPPPPPTKVDTGTLVVEVIVTGQPGFDFSTVTVTVKGNKDDGSDFSRTLTSRKDNVWTDEAMPLGSFTAKAEMITPPVMSGTAAAKIQAGQTTKVTITLTPGGVVATEFVVHFRFDKAFVEPCMRQVLTQVMQFASDHKDQKLLIVGHTDLVGTPPGAITGPDPYNQSLSERRARAVYAYLTFGRDQATTDTSVTEWNALRQKQSGGKNKPTLADNWGTREYQHMLQDLGFYPGAVDGQEGKLTQEAVRAFRCHSGLPPGTTMDDPAWDKLIRAYMAQDNFALADDRFLRNCGTESLKWIGCASQDPVKNVPVAHRPNRRVELLFTTDSKLPCEVPQPDTFDLLPPGDTVGSGWCVGPGDKSKRACFVVPHEPKDGKPKDKEWTRTLAEPGSITVEVSIKQEVKKDDGTIERKPVSAEKFVVITSDGQFLKGEQSRGEPDPDTTTDGKKTYSDKQPGIYSLEIVKPGKPSVMVQLEGEPGADAKGNVVCKHLTDKDNTLNVVILLDRVLRQVRLPAAAHLMRALNPVTHTVRTCPVFGKPGSTFEQKTVRDEAAVRAAFTAANEIWRQARIRFDLSNVVQEAYSFSVACEVTNSEFTILLERCAYPQVMNVFFVADLEGNAEAGVGVSIENGAAAGITGGCAVGDRFQFTIIGIPTDKLLDPQQTAQVLAHELGHVLNLDHTSDDSSNEKRLMFPATGLAGDNTLLVTDKTVDEIGTARASQGAGFECVPLTLTVKGATQVGGALSHEFLVIQNATVVTVDAQISDELLAEGTVTMTGGNAGANDRQRTVSAAAAGPPVEIVATYTPNSGGDVVTSRRVILVATFELRVEVDGAPQPKGTTKLTVKRSKGKVVTVIADIQPSPFCVPKDLVTWARGDEVPDPQRHTVSMDNIAITTVSATVAGVTQSVTITVIEVVFTDNVAPFDKTTDTVQIEGILNKDRASFDLGDLFGTQANSLFRARADFPGIVGNAIQGKLVSNLPNTAIVETRDIALTRTSGDRFVSLPILAIPLAIPRADVTMKDPSRLDLEIIRAIAGGSLRLQVPGNSPGPGVASAKVRGRIVEMCTITIQGATPSVDPNLTVANRVMAQCGIEFRILRRDTVNNPVLLDIQQTTCPLTIGGDNNRGTEETALFALGRANCSSNFIIYFVRSNSLGLRGCSAFPAGQPGVTVADIATQYTFAHEIGHVLHLPHDARPSDLMTGAGTGTLPANPANVDLFSDQCQRIDGSGFVVFRG